MPEPPAPPRLRVMSTLALAGVLKPLPALDLELAPTDVLLERIAAGARADLLILTDRAVKALAAAGTVLPHSRVPLAWSFVGLAVRQGAPRPDISTAEALAAALRQARSVALSRTGASGHFMAQLLNRLGIADEVNRNATFIPSGFTGERVLAGEADLAAQQVSELLAVPGLDVLGPLPPELGGATLFSAALFPDAPQDAPHDAPRAAHQAARQLVAALAAAPASMRRHGLEPAHPGEP